MHETIMKVPGAEEAESSIWVTFIASASVTPWADLDRLSSSFSLQNIQQNRLVLLDRLDRLTISRNLRWSLLKPEAPSHSPVLIKPRVSLLLCLTAFTLLSSLLRKYSPCRVGSILAYECE